MIDREKFEKSIRMLAEKSGSNFILGTGMPLTENNLKIVIGAIERTSMEDQTMVIVLTNV